MKCRACGETIDRATFWAGHRGSVTFPTCSAMCAAMTDADEAAVGLPRLKWSRIVKEGGRAIRTAAALFLTLVVVGCGGSMLSAQLDGADRALTATTGVADPLYAAAVSACDGAEAVIVARPATFDRDKHDMAQIRAACDRAFAAFESLRQAQLATRVLVAQARKTSAEPDAAAAFAALDALARAVDAAKASWEAASVVIQGAQARQ